MYIENTTNDVRNLINELETKEDLCKLKFLIYIFDLLNNNQINDGNEVNPDLIDKDIKIFTLDMVGLSNNVCLILLEYFVMLYNELTDTNDGYIDISNVIGIKYDKDDNEIISKFEKLNFNEKLDVFSEFIISYSNETYFNEYIKTNLILNGFNIAKLIQNFKT